VQTQRLANPRELIQQGRISIGNDPTSKRICELLLSELLSVGRTALYLGEKNVSEEISDQFFKLIEGIKEGEPIQYLLGKAPFMADSFKVTPACFIPRPDTELLVEACLDYFQGREKRNKRESSLLFIDLGTGSGCIAISLTKRLSRSKILAIDLLEDALEVARQNGRSHGVSERIFWICGDLFSPLRRGTEVDAVVANPPYIPSEEMCYLPPLVRREPRISLEGGEAGLHYYRRIAEESSSFIKEGGFLFLEIGEGQAAPIEAIFLKKSLRLVEVRKDILETPRVMIFSKGPHG